MAGIKSTHGSTKRFEWEIVTYYVGADWTESIGATHIKVGAVQPQENFDVIEAIGLDGEEKRTERVSYMNPQEILTSGCALKKKKKNLDSVLEPISEKLKVMSKSFSARKTQILQKVLDSFRKKKEKYFLLPSNTVGKTSQHHTAVAWWTFCNTQTRVVPCRTQITEACRPGIQQLAWQQGSRQTEKEAVHKKRAIPQRVCTLDESICNWWRGLSTLNYTYSVISQLEEERNIHIYRHHMTVFLQVFFSLLLLWCVGWSSTGCHSPPGSSLWSCTPLSFQQECPTSAEDEKENPE